MLSLNAIDFGITTHLMYGFMKNLSSGCLWLCKKCRKMRLKKEASLQDDQNTADFVR